MKARDLIGQRFERLVVLERDTSKPVGNGIYWICECDCGSKKVVLAKMLLNGKTRSCGCLRRELSSQRKLCDLTGQRFGAWWVLERDKTRPGTVWKCQCDCGAIKGVRSYDLVSGKSLSCGCLAQALKGYWGQTQTAEYRAWSAIKQRCYNPKCEEYPNYGGRGIEVCERWRDSFENFLADMRERPGPEYSIDRIDNDGHYDPANCRWATPWDQAQNRRDTITATYAGRTLSLGQWAQETGIDRKILYRRIVESGWPPEKAFMTPIGYQSRGEDYGSSRLTEALVRQIRTLSSSGWTITYISRHLGLAQSTVRHVVSGHTWKHVAT